MSAGTPEAQHPVVARRSRSMRLVRGLAWLMAGVVLFVLVLSAALAWYSTTGDFQRRVGKQVVSALEDATGGRVELRGLKFNLWHLAVELDGLVIHGLEPAGEAPYLAADKIEVRVKISNVFSHVAGTGLASHVGLNLLRVERPQVHLIIDKNGKTNQPVPKHPSTSKEPVIDTLLDLKADEADLINGNALVNDKAIPFNLAANNLNVNIHYLSASDRYGIDVDLNDLRTKNGPQAEAQSKLHIEGELGRDAADLKAFEFDSGKASVLKATASLKHFASPEWQAALRGSLELKQLAILANVDGLTAGSLELAVNGHNCAVTPAVAQTRPRFWQRTHPAPTGKPGSGVLPPDPDCKAGYLVVGNAKVHKAGFETEAVHLHDIDGGAQLHITPAELLLTTVTGYLPGGGSASGEFRVSNWLGETTSAAVAKSPTAVAAVGTANKTAATIGVQPTATTTVPTVAPSHTVILAKVDRIPLRTIMEITEPKHYGDLGFDTAVTGPVKVEWYSNVPVTVEADLQFAPTGASRPGALNNIPITGEAVARYDGTKDVVNIEHVLLKTPQSTTEATGILGVNTGDPLTDLQATVSVRDLGEFDQLLTTLDLEANGKKGTAAIPVVLHGSLNFKGTVSGRAADLDAKGHLEGTQLELKFGTQVDTLIDSLVADAEFSPDGGLAVASSTIRRGTALLNIAGSARPRRVAGKQSIASFVWDGGTSADATVQLANANLVDLLQIAGQQQKIPVTGTIAVNAKVDGTLSNMNGSGSIALKNGVAYDEPYDSVNVNLSVQGQDIEASQVVLQVHGVQITGNGGYDLASKKLHGHIEGSNLVLSKFQTIAKANPNLDGTLTLVADANGTMDEPGLKATAKLAGITADGKQLGDLALDAHSEASNVLYNAHANLVGAKVDATGQTNITGDYQTRAKLTIAGFDVGTAMALYGNSSVNARSSIGGTVTVDGPLKNLTALSGQADLTDFDVKLQGVELKTAEPLRIGLKNGIATLEQVHITGQDTDLQTSGTLQVFGATGPNGGKLDVKANGSVSVAIAHTFDPDIISSGKVEFTIAAGGVMKKPSLTGKIQFDNVNAAIEGIPNGLSALNGTLVFNEDRLQVESLTATTGGGQMKIGGSLTYNSGVYANLTATGETIRVRLYGLSATANTNFKLEGSLQSAVLSGNVLITRFGVGPDVDFAAFASNGGVQAPPDPSAASNKIRLAIQVASSPQLDFQNSYAKLAGTVDLKVGGTIAVPTVLGRIQITDGSATFAGTKYELQRGDIYFTNPVRIDPTIDVDATARVENYDLTVGVHGTSSNLKFTYRSEPPLSEADIFALLALGRTQEEAQLYQEQQVQAGTDPTTSALLGGALNATVSNRVEKLFGVGSVKIDPAFVGTLGNSAARITVQQQISRQLTATYATNVNSTAQQLLQAQYDLTPTESLVITRDESGVFSMVFKIRKRYR